MPGADPQSACGIGPDSVERKMVTMSEMYKNRKKVLIRGAGDLATGVGVALHRAGFRVSMSGDCSAAYRQT